MSGQALKVFTLNVAGKRFSVQRSLLLKFPATKLAQLSTVSEEFDSRTEEFYFDRNPKIMQNVLDLYRTGELHIPNNMCSVAMKKELDFWEIPEILISECCWKAFSSHVHDKEIQKKIEATFSDEDDVSYSKEITWKETVWHILDNPRYSLVARIWNAIYLLFIAVAIVVFCLFNEPSFRVKTPGNNTSNTSLEDDTTMGMLMHTSPNTYLYIIDSICLVFFTVEILVRFSVCPHKIEFIRQLLNILDVFLIIIMWIVFIMDRFPEATDESSDIKVIETFLRLCFSLRILRVFHFAKRSKTMKLLILTFKSSARELSFLMMGLAMMVLISATLVFSMEMILASHTFGSIHNALWWALITMTTVGYGDYVPKSVPGQVVGSVSAVIGIFILSLPIAIIASNFNTFITNFTASEHRKRTARDRSRASTEDIELKRRHSTLSTINSDKF